MKYLGSDYYTGGLLVKKTFWNNSNNFVGSMLFSDCWDALKNKWQQKGKAVMKYFQEKIFLYQELLKFLETKDFVLQGLNQ